MLLILFYLVVFVNEAAEINALTEVYASLVELLSNTRLNLQANS